MKVEIYKVIKKTAGGFHSWVESNVGKIRKPNSNIKVAEPVKSKIVKIMSIGIDDSPSESYKKFDGERANVNPPYTPNETAKTSLLAIAAIFGSVGGSILSANILQGSILLLISVGILTLRGYLKAKGII